MWNYLYQSWLKPLTHTYTALTSREQLLRIHSTLGACTSAFALTARGYATRSGAFLCVPGRVLTVLCRLFTFFNFEHPVSHRSPCRVCCARPHWRNYTRSSIYSWSASSHVSALIAFCVSPLCLHSTARHCHPLVRPHRTLAGRTTDIYLCRHRRDILKLLVQVSLQIFRCRDPAPNH